MRDKPALDVYTNVILHVYYVKLYKDVMQTL